MEFSNNEDGEPEKLSEIGNSLKNLQNSLLEIASNTPVAQQCVNKLAARLLNQEETLNVCGQVYGQEKQQNYLVLLTKYTWN